MCPGTDGRARSIFIGWMREHYIKTADQNSADFIVEHKRQLYSSSGCMYEQQKF